VNSSRSRSIASQGGKLNGWYENPLVLLVYIVLTVAMTYPAALFLSNKVMGGAGDNFHFLWELWYVAHALFDLHKSPFFDPDVSVPFGFSLIRNQDLSPGTVLLFSPLTQFFGEVFTYNVLVLASFPLTAFGAYLLARELWSNRLAAVLAGFIVGFCAYRFTHAGGHLSIVSTEWIPFFFLYLERLISKPKVKNAVLAGVFFGLSSWATWYYFFMVPIAAVFYVAVRINWKAPQTQLWQLLKLSVVSVGVASIFVLPFLVPYYLATRGAPVDYRGAGQSQTFAAALADYIIPPTAHFVWGSKAAQLWRNGSNGLWQSEWQLYLGTAALLLAGAGCFHHRRKVVVALVVMGLGCLLFSLGPGIYFTHPPPVTGSTIDVPLSPIPAPGRLLRLLPGFNNLRSWARFGFFVELSVGLLAAAGFVRLLDWMRERFQTSSSVQTGIAAITAGIVVFDFFPRPADMTSVAPRAADQWLARRPGNFAFMEYPIANHGYGGPAIYSTRLTGKRIIMGSGQSPPNLVFWRQLNAFPSPLTINLLYGWGAKYVLVDENVYRAGSLSSNIYQAWDTLEPAIKQTPRLKEVAVLEGVHVYELANESGDDGKELLTNGSFEESKAGFLPGWETIGKPTIDHTAKYAGGGRTGCAVTERDFLLSTPVAVEAGQCYRLSVYEKAGSSKLAILLLQVNWKNEHNDDVNTPSIVRVDTRSAERWQQSSMAARAPVGANYAVVHAQAARERIWVDDYSLKKIPADCEPVLFITPNPLSVPPGRPGRAAVSWNACCNPEAQVTLAINDDTAKVFATGPSGFEFLNGIKRGTRYEFRLYLQPHAKTAAQTAMLSTTERMPMIGADPNPVPAGPGLGRTKISWTTLARNDAEVYVSQDGGPEHLFAHGASGSVEVAWIAAASTYEFRLYSTGIPRRLLAKTIVHR